ncbi:TatD family hydrolase [Helicobacter heilmannii]|uniref:TatD family hydrolase n=1 Tax=Helicobacter heilmannii TaxID=35817 RepID=UPI0006A24594|nr:TatD family hydrolase [Helicobacter heilmannii]CRF46030.1 Putative deoxyribonuclease YcfH [Helicobacter heilmannii]CRF47708.1 Putative deoxyribonuclease YcfH [Helicobacter heilmannii]CRF48826.1 Putative deoxyribonuclease YcfH [Helicobacter heilmannii]CRF51295.1 Putative deoxyribonuclease YcfH [Helicobacter heilmannii]GMB95260.1 DNAse TatD [Helicobacter heilmannii]
MLELVDTHCHLDHTHYEADLHQVLEHAKEVGVSTAIIPAASPKDLGRAIALCEENPNLYFAVGVHPLDVQDFNLDFLRAHINHPKCVAVGECGLDYHYQNDPATKARQQEIFQTQIALALEHNKPLIVHTREASADVYGMLKAHPRLRGVLHCFNGDALLLELAYNFYYGIGGVATFKNAKNLVEVLPQIPLERLLLETDAPYLTPHPFRGQRNEPKYIPLVAQKLAQVRQMSVESLANSTTHNAQTLFHLKVSSC